MSGPTAVCFVTASRKEAVDTNKTKKATAKHSDAGDLCPPQIIKDVYIHLNRFLALVRRVYRIVSWKWLRMFCFVLFKLKRFRRVAWGWGMDIRMSKRKDRLEREGGYIGTTDTHTQIDKTRQTQESKRICSIKQSIMLYSFCLRLPRQGKAKKRTKRKAFSLRALVL